MQSQHSSPAPNLLKGHETKPYAFAAVETKWKHVGDPVSFRFPQMDIQAFGIFTPTNAQFCYTVVRQFPSQVLSFTPKFSWTLNASSFEGYPATEFGYVRDLDHFGHPSMKRRAYSTYSKLFKVSSQPVIAIVIRGQSFVALVWPKHLSSWLGISIEPAAQSWSICCRTDPNPLYWWQSGHHLWLIDSGTSLSIWWLQPWGNGLKPTQANHSCNSICSGDELVYYIRF